MGGTPNQGQQDPDRSESAADALYLATLAFFDEAAAAGVRHVVVSPGSRSTPLAVAARRLGGLRVWVQLDERVAGFFALGLARSTATPVVLVCTSGTASANYLPAVTEAGLAGVGLVVCTADRPPEARDVGAPQTTDQVAMFGSAVRWSVEMETVPHLRPRRARQVAARAVSVASGGGDALSAGPVHCNWPFRLPLEPTDELVESVMSTWSDGSASRVRVHSGPRMPGPAQVALLTELAASERGVVIAGPTTCERTGAAAARFAEACGWPMLADPLSGGRFLPGDGSSRPIATGDLLMRSSGFVDRMRPDVVLRVGRIPTSKAQNNWLAGCGAQRHLVIDPGPAWSDPDALATDMVRCDPAMLLDTVADGLDRAHRGTWVTTWCEADRLARRELDRWCHGSDTPPLGEAEVANCVAELLPDGAVWWLSSSLPVRDVDLAAPTSSTDVRVMANRGANGIDGVISSAAGVAASGAHPVVLSIGDLAVLHDLGGLAAVGRSKLALWVVVTDNSGGGIFDQLPIARLGAEVAFGQLFSTPHGTDLAVLDALPGLEVRPVADRRALTAALADMSGSAGGEAASPGVRLIHVAIDRESSRSQRTGLIEAVDRSLASIITGLGRADPT